MSKGLEALIRIEDLLNRLYETDVINDDHTHDTNVIEKELKALEIVKKYHITPAFFAFNESYQAYIENMSFYLEDEPLMSEEEYNLAKEVLNA